MKLGLEGVIRGIEADTSYFTGNQVYGLRFRV
jgi:allantoicase